MKNTAAVKAEPDGGRHEEECRNLLDNMPMGLAMHEPVFDGGGEVIDFKFKYINSAFEMIFGRNGDEILGNKITEFFPSLRGRELIRVLAHTAESGEEEQLEIYTEAPFYKWLSFRSFRAGNNRVALLCKDITREKRLGSALSLQRSCVPQ